MKPSTPTSGPGDGTGTALRWKPWSDTSNGSASDVKTACSPASSSRKRSAGITYSLPVSVPVTSTTLTSQSK